MSQRHFKLKMQLGILLSGCLFLVACADNHGKKAMVENRVQSAIDLSENAETLGEYETSNSSPRAVMVWAKEAKDPAIAQAICDSLEQMDDSKLVAFESAIRSGEFSDVFVQCQGSVLPTGDLISRLERYWHDERLKLVEAGYATLNGIHEGTESFNLGDGYGEEPANEKVQFATKSSPRDYSKGYKAVIGDVKKKQLVLTFDDGPHPENTSMVLKALREVNAKAMFFLMGSHAESHPMLTKAVARDGHMVGSHTYSHRKLGPNPGTFDFDYLSGAKAISEVRRGHQAILKVLEWIDPIFRFPYGNKTTEISKYVADNSMGEFFWTYDSRDWSSKIKDPRFCENYRVNKLSCQNTPEFLLKYSLGILDRTLDKDKVPLERGIILFHDIQRRTAEMLPQFLREVHARGYELVVLPSVNGQDRYNSKLAPPRKP